MHVSVCSKCGGLLGGSWALLAATRAAPASPAAAVASRVTLTTTGERRPSTGASSSWKPSTSSAARWETPTARCASVATASYGVPPHNPSLSHHHAWHTLTSEPRLRAAPLAWHLMLTREGTEFLASDHLRMDIHCAHTDGTPRSPHTCSPTRMLAHPH